MCVLSFTLPAGQELVFKANAVYCSSNSGRTIDFVNKHNAELEKEGIPAPTVNTPYFTQVSSYLLSQEESIQVVGNDSTGEVEVVLLNHAGKLYVTIGSDHADRQLERVCSPFAKQVCAKPLAERAWPLDELKEHWDQLLIKCYVHTKIGDELYQSGTVASIMKTDQLIKTTNTYGIDLSSGSVLFCGTILLTQEKLIYGNKYKIVLEDPVLGRKIEHTYQVEII